MIQSLSFRDDIFRHRFVVCHDLFFYDLLPPVSVLCQIDYIDTRRI